MNDGKIRFEQLANNGSEIKEGERVVTSHISSKYLQGILIGYVSEITTDANNLTRSGYITPAVDFQHLQEVLVITTTKEEMLEKEGIVERSTVLKRRVITVLIIVVCFFIRVYRFSKNCICIHHTEPFDCNHISISIPSAVKRKVCLSAFFPVCLSIYSLVS